MFDTGSPGIAKLDSRLFNELKLVVTDSIMAGDGSGTGTRVLPITTIDRIDIGSYIILHTDAMVRNYNTKPGLDSIDGVIGMDFFENMTLELNFEKNKFIIRKGQLSAGETGVVASPYIHGVPGIKLSVGNKTFNSIFDTGNMGGLTFLGSEIPREIMAGEPKVTGHAQTVSNTFEIKEVALNTVVSIGSIVFENPVVALNDMLRQSNIGIRFAKQMNITFDRTNELVKLVKYTPRTAVLNAGVRSEVRSALSEYTGQYGDRSVTAGTDGSLYIQRPNGMLLKMVQANKDEFSLEQVKEAAFVFIRNTAGIVSGIRISRDGGANWESVTKNE
jgi:hypothetical protein